MLPFISYEMVEELARYEEKHPTYDCEPLFNCLYYQKYVVEWVEHLMKKFPAADWSYRKNEQ